MPGASNLGSHLRIMPDKEGTYPIIFCAFSIIQILISKPDKEIPTSYFVATGKLIVKCITERQKIQDSQHSDEGEQSWRTDVTQLQDLL